MTTASTAMSFGPTGTAVDELQVEGARDARGARRKERQQTIVVTAAVAEPSPFAVERDAGDDDEVDRVAGNPRAIGQAAQGMPCELGPTSRARSVIAWSSSIRVVVVDARQRRRSCLRPGRRARARVVSHSLRKGSVTSTARARQKSGAARACARRWQRTPPPGLSAGSASRSASTRRRRARFAVAQRGALRAGSVVRIGRRSPWSPMLTHRTRSRLPGGEPTAGPGGWPYNRGSRRGCLHEPQSPDLPRSPRGGRAEDARSKRGGGLAPRAYRRRGGAQSRFDVPVSARQLFLLHVGLSRARGGHRARRRRGWRPARAVLPREGSGTGDLGRLPLRPRRGARDLRLRRGPPDRRARPAPAGARGRPARAVHAARLVRRLGPEDHRLAERSAQSACARGLPRPKRSSTCGRRSTRCGS